MFKAILAGLLALALSGCGALPLLTGMSGQAPAPLARTTIDDQGLETAWKAFDLALDAINVLGDLGFIVPGSERGKAVAGGIRTVNRALGAAERFAAAGSAEDYRTALGEAEQGLGELRAIVKGSK